MKSRIVWMILILFLLMGVGVIPLSIVSFDERRMDLYYEDSLASAPVTVKVGGGASAWKQKASSGWYTGLKGVHLGYRHLTIRVTLKIGNQYQEDKMAKVSLQTTQSKSTKGLNYGFTGTAIFQVPAHKVVPYMIHELDEETDAPNPQKGVLPYEISYVASITDVYTKRSGSWRGTCYIQIVGSVEDYLPEAPSPDEMESEPEPQEPIQDTCDQPKDNLQDQKVKDDDGGSQITSPPKGTLVQISIPIAFSIAFLLIAFLVYKRR